MLRVRGADAVRFLQGQLSNDVARARRRALAAAPATTTRRGARSRCCAWCSWPPDDVLALLPRELVAAVAARLGKFMLRAKVTARR